jgi:integrase
MSISQRQWESPSGKILKAWIYRYYDLKGVRRQKTFDTRTAAEDFAAETRMDLKEGIHIADRDSITVHQAGELWLLSCQERELEKSSIARNRQHVELHIGPLIGKKRLNEINVPAVRAFESALLAKDRSRALTRAVLVSLGSLLAEAQEQGLATSNAVRDLSRNRGKGKRKDGKKGRERPLAIGVDIPSPAEIRELIAKARGMDRALFTVLAFSGLRGSEARGLRWEDVDLAAGKLTVWQRADQWGTIGETKSAAGYRTIPLPPIAVNALKEWKLACPRRATGRKDAAGEPIRELHFVFPNGKGKVECHQHLDKRRWQPLQVAAGVAVPVHDEQGDPVPVLDKEGKPVLDDAGRPVMQVKAKYSGLHPLRHFYCSWCAAPREQGGLGLTLKATQVRMGHKDIAMTGNRYGHLWPSSDDAEVLAAAQRALLGA